MNIKTCKICLLEKPLDNFTPKANFCKPCRNERAKLWRKTNPKRSKEITSKYRSNPAAKSKLKLATEKWLEKNPDYHKKWYKEHIKNPEFKARLATNSKDWYRNNKDRAKALSRQSYFKRAYGISLEDYDRMYSDQKGCCAICGLPKETLCVDHNHKSGIVRGLLCDLCNSAIGFFREELSLLDKAKNYLMFHKTRQRLMQSISL